MFLIRAILVVAGAIAMAHSKTTRLSTGLFGAPAAPPQAIELRVVDSSSSGNDQWVIESIKIYSTQSPHSPKPTPEKKRRQVK